MLYNHKQFRKNSDKKIMRKVKKNWVVLSVASFALIGAATVMESNQNVAFASETQVSSNTTDNQNNSNNNNSTIDTQKNDAKAQLDAEASKVKDAIDNDTSLSQSDKDSQKAEVDAYKAAGEQSIDNSTDANSVNQALSNSINNIDASHVAGQDGSDQDDSNASSSADSSADQSSQSSSDSQSQQSSASSTSSDASLASSSSSSDDGNEGLSLRDGSSAPADSNTYISGPNGENGKDYKDAIASTKMTYLGVNKDSQSNRYVINFQFGSKIITKTGGVNRVLEFAINISPNLYSKVNKIEASNADGDLKLTNNNGQYYVKQATKTVVGGNVNISVYVDPVKVTSDDWISAFMSTHRETSKGVLIPTSTEIAFSATRSLSYDQFGNDFNSQLLSQLKTNALNDLNQTSPLNQATQLKNNYVAQINAVTTNDDFVNVLNSIQSAYRADNTSIANAITQLNNQATTSTNNVSNLSNLSSNDKQTAINWIKSALQTAQSNLMGVTQSSQIASSLSDGINSIKNVELQSTINSAINDINNAVTNTTNKIQSDITLSKSQVSQQLQNVVADKNNYTSQLQALTDPTNVAGVRNQGVSQINGEYVPGPAISTQKTTAKSQLNNEADKIKSAIDADNTLTSDEKNRQKQKVDDAKAAAQAQIDAATSADGINDALNQGINNIDSAHVTSTTTLSDQKANAKSQLDAEAAKVKNQIDADNTLTSADKTNQKNNVDSVKATDQAAIDAATNADAINSAYAQGIKDIDAQYVPGKTSVADQKTNAKAQLEAEATKVKNQIDADNTLTTSDKNAQKANVDSVKATDQAAIDAATNADGINSAYAQGIKDIDAQYVPGKTSVADQKANAKSQLEAEATKVKSQIDADNTLTTSDRNAQKANVDSVKATDQAAIDAATNADGINSAYAQGIKDIDAQYVPGKTSVADQKANAKAQLEAEATKVKNQIDADNTLTTSDKNAQKANVDSVKATDQAAIDAATNADGINSAYAQGIKDIDAQYVPGKTSLADQKTNAKANLDAQAAKIKNDIANDATLTQDQKNDQMDQLAADKVAAEQAIDNATDADGINKALGDGNLNMEADHQPGQSIESQKSAAKQAIQAEANNVKAAIAADTSLTSAEKDQQKNAVDSAANAAQAKIDGLTNADDINAAKNQGIQDVDGKHVSGTPLDTQKSTAKSQITNEANKIKQDIANDATLTQAQKDAQTAKVDADADAASKTIDNASDADSVNKAISDGTTNIDNDHVSKAPVDSQRSNALNQLDAQAAKVKQDIANDVTLTQAQKDDQTAKVDADAAAGKQAIQNATDADSINKALSDNGGKIANDHQPGSSVDNQKDSNNTNLDAEATKVKSQIDADVSLTGKEKDQQKSNVDSVKAAAEAKINAATNADGIKSAYDQGIKDIDSQYVPGKTSLPDQKAHAKAQLDAQAAKIKQDIANDVTLTQTQKHEQSAMVDADRESAETAIDNAKDADGVNQAINDGNKKIESDHQPGKSIDDQKVDAKAAIQAEANKIKSEIDADPTLTSGEKAAQKSKVDSVSSADQAKIDGLTNVDDIHDQITQSVSDIDSQHQPGKNFNDQKQSAKDQLDAQAAKIKQDIANDVTLTQADKDAQMAKVDSDTAAGKQAIDNAADADNINELVKENNDKIADDHVSNKSVDDQKTDAKKALEDQATKVKQDIANDATLTQAQKDAQIAKVDADKAAAEQAIDSAKDAEGVKEATDNGNNKINGDHIPGDSIDTQKAKAKQLLEDQAAKVKQDIANDATLTQAQKDAQTAQVDADKAAGEKSIDGASNADDINNLISGTEDKINGDHISGQSVNDQKASKKDELDAEANKVKAAIDADNTLTQAQKDAQKANIDRDVAAGKKAIDEANDAEGIKQAVDSSNAKIDGEHQSGKSVDDQKDSAKSSLDAESNKIKAAIDADNTLTNEEKAQQKNNVDNANQAAKNKIDNASNADEINGLVSQNIGIIDDQHQSGTPVSSQKDAAKNQLDDEANNIKAAIDADPTLSQSEKDAQKDKIDRDVAAGKSAIDNASNADGINLAISDAKKNIDADHTSGSPLSDQKQTAQNQLDAQAAKIKQDIDNDATLTTDEKRAQKAKIDSDVADGKNAINNANNADSINNALSDANDKIAREHVPGTSVSDQKSNANSQLDNEAIKIKNAIDADNSLTSEEKSAQKAKIDSDVAAGKQAIAKASDADSINNAVSDANKSIDAEHVPGTPLSDQKDAAKSKIDEEATKIKNDIDADNTLTSAEKAQQKANIDADVKSGKDAIDNATDADNVNRVVSETNSQVDKEHNSGIPVGSQRDSAKQQVEAQAAKVKNDIVNDATLTQAQRDAQIAQVDADKTAAEKSIDEAIDADGINKAISDGNAKIDADHVSGTSVSDQKDNAKNQLDTEATKIKNSIDADDSLTSAEKKDQKAKVDADVEAGKQAIDNATNADGINKSVSDANKSIDSEHVHGTPVNDQKSAAKQQIESQAAKVKQDISNDATLTQAQKDAQIAQVDSDKDAGETAIDSAANADDINKLISETIDKINLDHVSGQDVNNQKTSKKNELDAEANKVKAAIDADNTLTQDQKDAQKANVDSDVAAGKKAIDEANDAEGIKQAVDSSNAKIDGDHQPGKSLDDQKNAAKSALDAEANKIKAAIDADNTLTSSEKEQQKNSVDQVNKTAKDNIDAVTNADAIKGLVSQSISDMDSKHQSGKSVSSQQDAAKAQLDAQAAKVKDDIKNDATLTQDEKNAQSAQVDADNTQAKTNIDNAKDADAINQALSDGNANIIGAHQPGKSLDEQKMAAKQATEDKANQIKALIDADVTLTSAEKEQQKNKVDSEKEDTQNKINAATNADEINSLSDRMIGDIKDNYVPGSSLDDQKKAAKAQLDQRLQDLLNAIFGDDTLTQAEKQAQKDQANADKIAAEKAIDEAADADNINQSLSDGHTKIEQDHNHGDSIDAQKDAAKQQLESQAAKVKNDIQNDATLTQAQRDAQVAKVDADKTAAEKAVDDATNADDINKAISDGNDKIASDHVSGTSVSDQKKAAKDQLDTEATKIKNAIDADNSLTSDEKDVQKAKVDADVKAGKEAIDNATEADNINKVVSDTNAKVDKDHVAGTPVDSQKDAAKKQLESQATKTKQDITNDATLTQVEKDAQIAKVEADKTAGEKAIDDANDADSINQALVDSNKKIGSDHVPGKSLTDQKDAAKKQLDAEAEKTKATIDADKTLTSAEKEQQKANVDAKNNAAQDNVDAQTNSDNINTLTAQGVEEIDAQYVPGKVSLSDQKTNAKAKLEEEATKVKNDILNDATLTKAEKDAQIANVDADKAAGENAIDDALDADGINQAVSDSNAKMVADYVPGKTSLPDQKSNAKAQLDAQAAKVKNDIANDATLTQAEKDAQMAQVDADKAAAEQVIDNAPDADSINQAISNGNAKIATDYVPGKSVDDQKNAAKSDLDAKAAKVKNDIANDATLTQAEKDAQMAQVDADKTAGEQAIDNAPDADSINQIISDTNAKIDADHVSGKSLDDQKLEAKAEIDAEAKKVKAQIDADKTLSKAEKQRQKNNVDRAKEQAKAEIDSSSDASAIKSRIHPSLQILDIQYVKKQNNGSGPEQVIPRNVYMVKNFYRYLSTNFTKKNRVEGYKATSRPNAAMFRIIGETINKNGVKRYKVYQIVVKKNGLFKVDRKKWGYITAKSSYMRPLYYSSNVHQIKVIGRGIREYKNVKLSKAVKGYKQGTVLNVKAVKKYGSTYRLQLTNGHYITANKNLVRKQTTPRNVYMVKGFYRYSSVNFSHKNRIQGYKNQARPNAVMFRVVGETTNKKGLKRYKVYQIVRNKKGLFRVDHKKWGYITTKPSYVRPLYYSSKVRAVRVIGSRIRAYNNIKLTKSVKSYKRGTVLNVKAVKKVGTTYRLQLTNGSYISANKNLVQKVK
ncbi:hypothetical protein RZ76_13940 [Apilactobacillus kunkeei]|uniref:DUF1542 domain-containing protein n=1 Tax=Apilactobacillus kunkeei TaxID=148814 RepID=UPI0006CE8AC0|nr:DUF1542 domain-containing protein [Apilactobacillus kunkeei]KPN83323.1 hypothetical protein RZ76_13940 [Apilactobacillus kunkeei]